MESFDLGRLNFAIHSVSLAKYVLYALLMYGITFLACFLLEGLLNSFFQTIANIVFILPLV